MRREYTGRVKGLKIVRTSSFGIRLWEVKFASGKAYFELSMKRPMPFSINDKIRFGGEWMEAINGKYFQILNIVDVNDIILWEKHEQQRMAEFVIGN